MDPKLRDAYAAARKALLVARLADEPDPAAVEAAQRQLIEATTPIAVEVQAAWDRNIVAVQDAKAALVEARRAQTRVEVETGNAARTRNPFAPVLSADELDRCHEAAAVTEATRRALEEARGLFKAGVTADQLDEVP